jgi:hypothetical protein
MYLVVKDTGALQALTGTGLFITARKARECADYLAQRSKVDATYTVISIDKEWKRQWKKRRAEARKARRMRKFNALTNKRNKISRKIRKLQQGG